MQGGGRGLKAGTPHVSESPLPPSLPLHLSPPFRPPCLSLPPPSFLPASFLRSSSPFLPVITSFPPPSHSSSPSPPSLPLCVTHTHLVVPEGSLSPVCRVPVDHAQGTTCGRDRVQPPTGKIRAGPTEQPPQPQLPPRLPVPCPCPHADEETHGLTHTCIHTHTLTHVHERAHSHTQSP